MSEIAELKNCPDINFIGGLSLQEVLEMGEAEYRRAYLAATGEEPEVSEADPAALCRKSAMMVLYQVMQLVNEKGRRQMLKTATDEALDALAANNGLVRKEPERAQTVLRFTLAAAQSQITAIPAGTRVKTQAGQYFNTLEYAQIPAGEMTVEAAAQAEEAGTGSDGLAEGSINILVDPIPYVASAENVTVSSGGTDAESDESLTRRIYLSPSAYSCAGPFGAYEYYAAAWRNDVADVRVVSPAACEIVIYFMLEGGKIPDRAELAAMEAYMMEEVPRPATDLVRCKAPQEVGYTIDVTYWVDSESANAAGAIQTAVAQAVADFQSWQRRLGRDINPTELIYRMRAAGAKRVTLYGPADKVVEETQIAKCNGMKVRYGGIEHD